MQHHLRRLRKAWARPMIVSMCRRKKHVLVPQRGVGVVVKGTDVREAGLGFESP